MLSVVFSNIWNKKALSDEEKEAIHGPMSAVIYKHGGSIPVEWQLVAAIGFAAAPRYVEHKAQQQKDKAGARHLPAAQSTIPVP